MRAGLVSFLFSSFPLLPLCVSVRVVILFSPHSPFTLTTLNANDLFPSQNKIPQTRGILPPWWDLNIGHPRPPLPALNAGLRFPQQQSSDANSPLPVILAQG